MSAPDRRLPFAFVDDLDAPVLSDGDRHHLERARRLRPGDELTVGDGAGRFRLTRFGPELEVHGDVQLAPPPASPVTIAFALTKADKPELVVQKLVEIGVHRIVPFVAERTVVRWDPPKAARNLDRWHVIAREAAAQAHRPHLAEVAGVATFAEVAALPGATLAHPDGEPMTAHARTVLVGPEGGWSPAEEAAVDEWVRIGPHILRAETAALVAGALAVAVRVG
jgi:16S rRNA (uracil1498-N3)-methyltransferase